MARHLRNFLVALCCLWWAYWSVGGWESLRGFRKQPSVDEYVTYAVIPVLLLCATLAMLIVRHRREAHPTDAALIALFAFLVLPYVFVARGGI